MPVFDSRRRKKNGGEHFVDHLLHIICITERVAQHGRQTQKNDYFNVYSSVKTANAKNCFCSEIATFIFVYARSLISVCCNADNTRATISARSPAFALNAKLCLRRPSRWLLFVKRARRVAFKLQSILSTSLRRCCQLTAKRRYLRAAQRRERRVLAALRNQTATRKRLCIVTTSVPH